MAIVRGLSQDPCEVEHETTVRDENDAHHKTSGMVRAATINNKLARLCSFLHRSKLVVACCCATTESCKPEYAEFKMTNKQRERNRGEKNACASAQQNLLPLS
jgi:hypothetical protein